MTNNQNTLRDLAISFPIAPSLHRQAEAYASQYFTQGASERTYLNALAVIVADAYFQMLSFETNLTKPERWNAAQRLWSEASELELVGLGNLECRAIASGQQTVFLPPETWSDRIGYLFIEIDEDKKEAVLLGFLPAFDPELPIEEVSINDLKSMDDLMDYLTDREASSIIAEVDELAQEFAQKKITYIRNWLNNIYEKEWEYIAPKMQMRGASATHKKKIQLAEQIFEMQLCVRERSEAILVEVIIQCVDGFLPVDMQVSVPDESEIYTETVMNSSEKSIFIPLEFQPDQEFWVELRIGSTAVKEYFIA